MCVGKTLNMDSCSKFWGNLEGIWGNPGEIPHSGWKIPGVYRVKSELIQNVLPVCYHMSFPKTQVCFPGYSSRFFPGYNTPIFDKLLLHYPVPEWVKTIQDGVRDQSSIMVRGGGV